MQGSRYCVNGIVTRFATGLLRTCGASQTRATQALAMALCISTAALGQQVIVHPGENAEPTPGPAGVAPYEMAGRQEERPALANFEDATRWKVEGINAEGWLYRSDEQKLFSDQVGKLVYVARGDKPVINVMLNEPVEIPEPWDTFTFWNYGNNWGWAIDPKTPQLSVAIMLQDADGKPCGLWPGVINYEYWFLMSARLQPEIRAQYKPPFKLMGFQFNNGTNVEKRTIWLGPCYAYKEELKPLTFEPWPEKLPFPTREETILPTNKVAEFMNEVRMEGEATVFAYRGKDTEITYRYRPVTGTLSDIEVEYRGKIIHPLKGGGMQLTIQGKPVAPDDPAVHRALKSKLLETKHPIDVKDSSHTPPLDKGGLGGVSSSLANEEPPLVPPWQGGKKDGEQPREGKRFTASGKQFTANDKRFTATWRLACGKVATDVTYTMQIRQKSLIVDIAVSEPIVERVALGRVEPVREAQLFKIPYMTFAYGYRDVDPRLLYTDGLFLFTQFDWYRSDGSKLIGGGEISDKWAVCNIASEYLPKTDGERNLVRERLFINVSPDVQEVLPTIPNPPSPFKETMGDRVWRVKYGGDHAAEVREATGLRRYGCEKVAVRFHEDSWRDAGESFTFRLNAAPGRGGDAALRRMVDSIRDLGWLVGLYTNYTDFAPVNSYWSPDHVCRESNGNWQGAWMRCYSAKPMWAVEMEAKLAPQIAAKFNPNHSYCDVHTAIPPWERNDYDARVPGAGMFRQTFECYGRIMLGEKAAYRGPVYSEGLNHWMYAGLTDGNYAQILSRSPSKEPLFVDFDLLKIHPLEMDAGMGSPGMFFKAEKPDLDQFIATTLAYGHIGYMEWSTMEGTLKIYNMVQPVQRGYVMEQVETIEYEHEGRMLNTSEALVTGAYLRNRVHIAYFNGTQVYVNGSDSPWAVELPLPMGQWELPKWGWAVWTEDGCISVSAIPPATGRSDSDAERRRIDLCRTPTQYYADSRGPAVRLPDGVEIDGSAVLKKEKDGWYLTPTVRCREFVFAPGIIGMPGHDGITAVGLDPEGREVGKAEVRRDRGIARVLPGEKPAFRYRIQTVAAGGSATKPATRSRP